LSRWLYLLFRAAQADQAASVRQKNALIPPFDFVDEPLVLEVGPCQMKLIAAPHPAAVA
jgi:hypothetical protein